MRILAAALVGLACLVVTSPALAQKKASQFDVGEVVAVSGLGENRRAQILRVDPASNSLKVQYLDDGFAEWVNPDRLLSHGDSWADDAGETLGWAVVVGCMIDAENCLNNSGTTSAASTGSSATYAPAAPINTSAYSVSRHLAIKNDCNEAISLVVVYTHDQSTWRNTAWFTYQPSQYTFLGPNSDKPYTNYPGAVYIYGYSASGLKWTGNQNFDINGTTYPTMLLPVEVDSGGGYTGRLICPK